MITAKYILESEAGERFDLTAPANIFLVNVEGLGITTNVTYGDLENGFFHTLYEQTPQNNITGDLIYQTAAYDNYQTLVNWIVRAKTLYFCYQPLETEYRRIVKLNYISKERRTAGGWMRAGISFSPMTPWYLAQPTEIGMGGIEEELSKGYFQDGEASPTIEPVQDLHGFDNPWPGGAGKNLLPFASSGTQTANGVTCEVSGGVVTLSGTATAATGFSYDLAASVDLGPSANRLSFFNTLAKSGTNNVTVEFYRGTTRVHYWAMSPVNRSVVSWTDSGNEVVDKIRIAITSGTNVGGMKISPMLTVTSADYSTFAPYENICPITPGLTFVRDDESTLVVYGGTLDAATGTLTVTWKKIALGDYGFGKSGDNNFYISTVTDFKTYGSSVTRYGLGISDTFKFLVNNWTAENDTCTCYLNTGYNGYRIFIHSEEHASDTVQAFKAWLQNINAEFVYELAAPITYQLTEAEVSRALEALGGSYGYRYTVDLRYGGDAAGTMSATIAPSGHVPAAVVLRYTGAITNPRVRLVGAETGIVYGICAINTSLTSGQGFELSTRYEDSHVTLIDGDGTETSLLGYVNQAYETYFRCPTTESAVLTIESDSAFAGDATLLVYTYFGSV